MHDNRSAVLIKVCPRCGTKNRIPPHRTTLRPICGKCRESLIDDLHCSYVNVRECLICNKMGHDMEALSNGSAYHKDCLLNLINNIENIETDISKNKQKIDDLEVQLKKTKTVTHFIKSLLTGETVNEEDIRRQIALRINNIKNLSSKKVNLKDIIFKVYTFWLTYPPDWNERCMTIRSSGRCAECGASSRNEPLHVHHKIPISKGGNHAIDNLIPLCEECHSLTHGGREFSYSSSEKIGSFEKRVKLLNNAINNNTLIHFNYTRRDGQKSVRTIRPQALKHVCGALCVFGYCYLRGEERTFAVRRMKSIVRVSEPGRCYYE